MPTPPLVHGFRVHYQLRRGHRETQLVIASSPQQALLILHEMFPRAKPLSMETRGGRRATGPRPKTRPALTRA